MNANKNTQILKLENRISLLEGRSGKENGRIIQKLKRQLSNLTGVKQEQTDEAKEEEPWL